MCDGKRGTHLRADTPSVRRVASIRAHDKNCIGCQVTGSSIMVSFQAKQGGEVVDLLLDSSQADHFHEEFTKCMQRNKEDQEPHH